MINNCKQTYYLIKTKLLRLILVIIFISYFVDFSWAGNRLFYFETGCNLITLLTIGADVKIYKDWYINTELYGGIVYGNSLGFIKRQEGIFGKIHRSYVINPFGPGGFVYGIEIGIQKPIFKSLNIGIGLLMIYNTSRKIIFLPNPGLMLVF